jgi:hypothetical protein
MTIEIIRIERVFNFTGDSFLGIMNNIDKYKCYPETLVECLTYGVNRRCSQSDDGRRWEIRMHDGGIGKWLQRPG